MKKCSKCNRLKSLEEFSFNKRKNDGHQTICKVCFKLYRDKHYIDNKQYYIDKSKEFRQAKSRFINDIKNNSKCQNCEESHISCLDFHHTQDFKKDYEIGNMRSFSEENILKEIDKCIILCSNCHRKVHYEEKCGKGVNRYT
jgi:hypothetical protein